MLQAIWTNGFLASVALFITTATAQSAATATVPVGPIQTMGCFKDVGNLKDEGSNTFQTSGSCQVTCANLNMAVMATTQGSFCYCGQALPPEQYQADNSSCSSPCNGYGQDVCGGLGYWTVYLTGLTGELISTQSASSSTSSPTPSSTSGSSTTTKSTSTQPAQKVTVTASASSTAAPSSGATSKVGIAVGVVVGILALATLIGGLILYLRRKRRAEIEEDHRRNAAAASKSESKFDARLDAGAINARRTSIGSIADEGDFSRRILQVRNPDANRNSNLSQVSSFQHV